MRALSPPLAGGRRRLAQGPLIGDIRMEAGLRFGSIGSSAVHLCVDMQRLFQEPTPWRTPWMEKVLPQVCRLTERDPEWTIFTRFIPARAAGAGHGTWQRYYAEWSAMTIDAIGEDMVELVPELACYTPPAQVIDKHVYAPWIETDLHRRLRAGCIDTLIISGGETEMCVLATVMGAVDFGYRVVLAADALCSSADETHDAMMRIYDSRFGLQVELAPSEEILAAWNPKR